jgi:hypothetical protein
MFDHRQLAQPERMSRSKFREDTASCNYMSSRTVRSAGMDIESRSVHGHLADVHERAASSASHQEPMADTRVP